MRFEPISWLPPPWRLLVALLLLPVGAGASVAQDVAAESLRSLKAAFVFNFTLYTQWPAELGDSIGICIAGQDDLGAALDALTTKQVYGRPVTVRRLEQRNDFTGCHLLYIAGASEQRYAQIVKALQNKPVLTVGEGMHEPHLMIRLLPSDSRLVFEIDHSAAKAAGLRMSAGMLRLARKVY